jgi:hypothetical protein
MSIPKNDIINPEFSTSVFYGKEPISSEKLLKILDEEIFIIRDLRRIGFIHSKKYLFINPANFPDSDSGLLRVIENHYNTENNDSIEKCIMQKICLETFYNAKNENQQIIYDSVRISQHQALLKFEKIFNVNCF